jgi:amidase
VMLRWQQRGHQMSETIDRISKNIGPCPPPPSEWDFRSTGELAAALQDREICAAELLEYTIARIEALDQCFNAVVVRDFDRARDAAKAADAALACGVRKPLLGIPITLKEAFNISGLPTTWGYPQFRDFVPKEDALIVSRLKGAGAVIVGKTNVPIGLGDFQSYNEIYGTTNNPWDVSRSPGGSSGGSAAALAAGFGPLSVGSDIGGSLRVPAHFCGVYAHKPTFDLVPLRGYNPPSARPLPGSGDLGVAGPLARCASDLLLALGVIAGPDDAREGIGYELALPRARHDNLSKFRVLVIDSHPLMPTSDVVRTAIARLAERIARSGAKIAYSSPLLPDLAESAGLYMKLLAAAKSSSLAADRYATVEHQAASMTNFQHNLRAERTRGTIMSHRDWLMIDAKRRGVQEQWRSLFGEWDVVIYPSAAIPAFAHDHSEPIEARHLYVNGQAYPFLDACFAWADPASTCGLPATAVPIDHSPEGLPIGVQIIGPYLEDLTTINFARLLEQEFGGFVRPPGL